MVDVFDALTSERPYKNAFSLEEAKTIIRDSSGSHFDPAIVDSFLENADHLFNAVGTALHDDLVVRLHVITRRYFVRALCC